MLPQPMLARPDSLPRGDWSFEVKWDGFRAIVATEDGFQVRSRRGWSMADRAPELADLPKGLVLDGELVAFALDGRPSFPLLCLRVLHGREAIPVTFMVFDVLRVEGADAMCLPYADRRALLEELDLTGQIRGRRGGHRRSSTTARRCSRRSSRSSMGAAASSSPSGSPACWSGSSTGRCRRPRLVSDR
jgi:ATP-dependent DNA ligase